MRLLKTTAAVLLSLGFLLSAVAKDEQAPYLFILGVAQDAGYPQAGCYKPHCLPGWQDKSLRRGATSIALIDPTAKQKYLFEATPNLPSQLFELERQAPSEQYNLAGVFLTHAHIGHYAGLMYFGHEAMGASNVPVFAMPKMKSFLEKNGPWSQLVDFQNIKLQALKAEKAVNLNTTKVTPFLVPHRDEFSETVGYRIDGPNKTAVFIPDIDKWEKWQVDLVQLTKSVDYLLIDATFFGNGELPGRDMSKVPHPLVTESMQLLDDLSEAEKQKVWFIHFNHTNPLLNDQSEEAKLVRNKGFNIAREGVSLEL